MSKVKDVLITIRDSLSDFGDRWTDERLIRLIDEAHKIIIIRLKLRRASAFALLTTLKSNTIIILPSDVAVTTRVSFEGGKVPFTTFEELDKRFGRWENDIGKIPIFIIHDRHNRRELMIYPQLTNLIEDVYILNTTLGIVTDISTFTNNTEFGIVTDIEAIDLNEDFFNTIFGIITAIVEQSDIRVYYAQKPDTLINLTDEILIDNEYDSAIKHYTVGMALRDDKDTQNRAAGAEELQLFDAKLVDLEDDVAKNFVGALYYETSYEPGVGRIPATNQTTRLQGGTI